jgi:hypothetical protein
MTRTTIQGRINMAVHAVDGTVKVIYETLKLRSTGAHTRVWDMRPDETYDGNFKLECVTHGREFARPARLKAEEESHRSHMWCDLCVIPEAGKEIRVNTWVSMEHGTEIAVNAMPDSARDNARKFAGWFPQVTCDAPAPAPRLVGALIGAPKATRPRSRSRRAKA